MSRIGKMPVAIPKGVEVKSDGGRVRVKGPKGELSFAAPTRVSVEKKPEGVVVTRHGDDRQARAYHGLTQRLVQNMVTGVTSGFSKGLEISGVGYRAQLQGTKLVLALGYSHPVEVEAPEGIEFRVETPTRLAVFGADKELVGQTAAYIRSRRKPEPYKGKGIKYAGEQILRKAGKAGKVGGAA